MNKLPLPEEPGPREMSRFNIPPSGNPADNVLQIQDWRKGPNGGAVQTDGNLAITIEQPDGGLMVILDPESEAEFGVDSEHWENLAEKISDYELHLIGSDILDGIQADDQSRAQWLSDRATGIDLLGLKIEKPRTEPDSGGMSTIKHPLLLEACLKFQANARGELLPANGPVKVKNNGLGTAQNDTMADQLEEDLNRYLTSHDGAPEYYPDTDRMLFGVGFSGMGFKKLYHDPLRRRPVSESVDAKDLIVSNDATDIRNAGRVTQVIRMRKAIMKRMQYVGAYRDVDLSQPPMTELNRVDQKIKQTQGIRPQPQRPQDNEYTVYECYCELDIPGFEHRDEDGRITGLPLPYKVSIEKTSQKILEIRRNWNEDDDDFQARRVFVAYPFAPMFGFYASGLLQILGNTTAAVTGAWRMLLDAGMFANFPGFLYAKTGARQENLNFRVAPGQGQPVTSSGGDIRQTIMALPYKEPGPATMQLVDNIATTGQRVGGTAEIAVGEGRQDAPVGTTIALIEQAAKVMDAVHKRLHAAQAEEFQILLELFREDPEALFRFLKRDGQWTLETLQQALDNYDLQPVADPNTPTHMHRLMKMMALKQMADASPDMYNMRAVDERILRSMQIDDPENLFMPPEAQQQGAQPMDPAATLAIATATTKMKEIESRERQEAEKTRLKTIEMASNEAVQQQRNQIEREKLQAQAIEAERQRASDEYLAKMDLAKDIALKDMDGELQAAGRQADRVFNHADKAADRAFKRSERIDQNEQLRQNQSASPKGKR